MHCGASANSANSDSPGPSIRLKTLANPASHASVQIPRRRTWLPCSAVHCARRLRDLNVFTPADATAGSNKTVLFWVYGGNLQSGSAAIDLYDGSSLAANQDVVVVTFGYRINGAKLSFDPTGAVVDDLQLSAFRTPLRFPRRNRTSASMIRDSRSTGFGRTSRLSGEIRRRSPSSVKVLEHIP